MNRLPEPNLEREGVSLLLRLGTAVRLRRSDIEAVLKRLAEGGAQRCPGLPAPLSKSRR